MELKSKIYLAGHSGLVGSALHRKFKKEGFSNLVLRTSQEVDLRDQHAVAMLLEREKPEYIFLAAAKVGGIMANSAYPGQFIYDNIAIQTNVIHQAYLKGVKKLLFLGSSCIYPKNAPQPMKEDYLLSGPLEETNEPYAVAKIAGIKMCQAYNRQYGTNFIAVMPTNLYGPNDNFNLENSHVLPALIRKFHEAKVGSKPYVEVWGTGRPHRELLHVDDLAAACLYLMHHYDDCSIINIGTGEDVSIASLAELIRAIVGYRGEIKFDYTKPDGTPRKLLDISRIKKLGWKPTIDLKTGIEQTYKWYKNNA